MRTRTGKTLSGPLAALATLFCLVAFAAPASAAEPVEYYASVDRNTCALDETITLQVSLTLTENGEPETLEMPATPDFDVLSQSRSDSTSFQLGGGGPSFKKVRTFTLILRPAKQGELAIEPGTVVWKGKRYQTGRITVSVGPPGSGGGTARPAPPQRTPFGTPPGFPPMPGFDDDWDPFAGLLGGGPEASDADVFLRASVDKGEVYLGEQVTLSLYLLSRVGISNVQGLKMPKLDGFWSEEIAKPTRLTAERKIVDGIAYDAYLITRRALFPLEAGKHTIEPAELDIVAGGRGFFGRGRSLHRKSVAATVNVKPLPAGAPASFATGNVGAWKLQATAGETDVSIGDPVTIEIIATGVGNLGGLELPPLPAVDGFKSFDPTQKQESKLKGHRYGGRKSLEYVLVAEKAGTFTVPALELAYFDPASGKYEVARSEPLSITVRGGQGAVATSPAAPAAPGPKQESGGLEELRGAAVARAAEGPIYEKPWFLAGLLVPGLAVLGAIATPALRRRRGKASRRIPSDAQKAARKRLADARNLSGSSYLAEIDGALQDAMSMALRRSTAGLARDESFARLRAAGISEQALAALREALELCDAARFAPAGLLGAEELDRLHGKAEVAITGLETDAGEAR